MAKVRRVVGSNSAVKPTVGSAKRSKALSLPSKLSRPSGELGDYTWLLYGERKIGKTTLASCFRKPFFLMFEPGGKALEILQRPCNSWTDFLGYIKLLEDNPSYCDTLVIDTGQRCYDRCTEATVGEMGVEHPSDVDWGKAWSRIDQKFQEAHQRIFDLNIGFVVTAHSEIKTIKTKGGLEYSKLTTQLSKQAIRFYLGIVDVMAYYQYEDKNRVLTIRGNADLEAGTRIKKHFQFTDGSPITNISMGDSEEEAYRNLESAFYNQISRGGGTTTKKKKLKLKR